MIDILPDTDRNRAMRAMTLATAFRTPDMEKALANYAASGDLVPLVEMALDLVECEADMHDDPDTLVINNVRLAECDAPHLSMMTRPGSFQFVRADDPETQHCGVTGFIAFEDDDDPKNSVVEFITDLVRGRGTLVFGRAD